MAERAAPVPRPPSRRAVVKGLLGLTLTLAGIGCTPVRSSPPATPTLRPPTSSPSNLVTLHTPVFTYHGHRGTVDAVAWHGRRIASGSDDGTVQVWDAATGGHTLTYRGHSSKVSAVAWSPDGRRIASGSVDTTVQICQAG